MTLTEHVLLARAAAGQGVLRSLTYTDGLRGYTRVELLASSGRLMTDLAMPVDGRQLAGTLDRLIERGKLRYSARMGVRITQAGIRDLRNAQDDAKEF